MKSYITKFLILVAGLGTNVAAQAPSGTNQLKGFTALESMQGTLNSSDKLLKLDSNIGYDFNKHFGVFTGIPVYFTNISTSSTTTTAPAATTSSTNTSNNGLGNYYLGLILRAPHPNWNFASTITAGAPTGSTKKGYSSGRGTIDWSNRIERSFDRITPFVEAGLANSVPDTVLLTRPFTSLGMVGHLEEGGEYELVHHFSVGASGYQILPAGTQKIFSKLVESGGSPGGAGGATSNGKGDHNRVFAVSSFASGNDLTRENGFNTWVAFEPTQFWRAELGYSRSMTFDFNSFTFNIGLNVGKLLRSKKGS